jgi:hypothetical protein
VHYGTLAQPSVALKARAWGRHNLVIRVVGLLVVGVAVGVATTTAFFIVRHQTSWQEQAARSQADALACNLGQVGLGVKPCAKLLSFRKTAPSTWETRIGTAQHSYCFRLHTYEPPRRCDGGT